MLRQNKKYKDERVEQYTEIKDPEFKIVSDEKEGIFYIDSTAYEHYKRYISFILVENLMGRLKTNTQIREYRIKDFKDIIILLKNHQHISVLKQAIVNKFSESPGIYKQCKRLFHGFLGKPLPKILLPALEVGENANIKLAMRYLDINLDNILKLSNEIFESVPHRNKLTRSIYPKTKIIGNDLVGAKRYLIFALLSFAVQQTQGQIKIHENIVHCLLVILDRLYNTYHNSIKDYDLNLVIEREISAENENSEKKLARIAEDKLRVADAIELNKLKEEEHNLEKFKIELPNILLPLQNLIKSALEYAEDTNIQSVMQILGFEFEKQGYLFYFLGIKFDVVNVDLKKDPEVPLRHMAWCSQFHRVIAPQNPSEQIQEALIHYRGSQQEAKMSAV